MHPMARSTSHDEVTRDRQLLAVASPQVVSVGCGSDGVLGSATCVLGCESGYAAAPDCAPLLYAWAYFEMHQGRMREVQELLNKARDLDEHAGQLWHMQALLQIKLKQLRVARATAEEGV